eukprot:6469548-Amphidinium_carterae.1
MARGNEVCTATCTLPSWHALLASNGAVMRCRSKLNKRSGIKTNSVTSACFCQLVMVLACCAHYVLEMGFGTFRHYSPNKKQLH